MIREAVVLRGIRVRLLVSFWKKTHPLTFNFVSSLNSLCMQLVNCSIEVVREATQSSNMFPESFDLTWTFFMFQFVSPDGILIIVLQRFFSLKDQSDDFQLGLNHNKYMVTDNAVYIGMQCRK